MPLPRMRTAKEALIEIKNLDPNSCVTEHAIRVLVSNYKLPVVKVGRKSLFNLDKLIEFLENPPEMEEIVEYAPGEYGTVRKIY